MPQILVRPEDIQGARFTVRGDEAHHLIRVLRKQPGDEIQIFDGAGRRFHGRLIRVAADEPAAEGEILSALEPPARRVRVRLFQGLPKGAKFDYVIEKATELGVDEIVPFLSAKGQVRLDAAQREAKAKRWRSLVAAASKQCNRPKVPVVSSARPLRDLADPLRDGSTLVLWEEEKSLRLKRALESLDPRADRLNLVIGPESGFADDEIRWMGDLGARAVSLGERILRTETAGLVALAAVNYALDLF